jgi:hypothetical protein
MSKEVNEAIKKLRQLNANIDAGKKRASDSLATLEVSNPELRKAIIPLYDLLCHIDQMYAFKTEILNRCYAKLHDTIMAEECDCHHCTSMKVKH